MDSSSADVVGRRKSLGEAHANDENRPLVLLLCHIQETRSKMNVCCLGAQTCKAGSEGGLVDELFRERSGAEKRELYKVWHGKKRTPNLYSIRLGLTKPSPQHQIKVLIRLKFRLPLRKSRAAHVFWQPLENSPSRFASACFSHRLKPYLRHGSLQEITTISEGKAIVSGR